MGSKIALIIILAVILILLVLFVSWFFTMKANGKCPLCALKKLTGFRKITMDISDVDEYDNNSALTPPMGWASWNKFRNHIDQDKIYETAKAMKNSGLADAGYTYVNIDDCWQSSMRDRDGKLQGDLGTFSRGMQPLIRDINGLGLKVGLYSSNGTLTCEDMPASLGNEVLDAKTLVSWGCEFFKYDFCHNESISGDCPAVEKIELNRLDYDGDDVNTFKVLEPEDATFTGRARVIKLDSVPSKKAIGYINHGAGTAEFEVTDLPKGRYALTVVHQKNFRRKDSYAQIIVNGKLYEMFFPKGKGFSDTGRTQLEVELKDGMNKIKIFNPVVTRADSAYIQYKRMGDALKEASQQWADFTNTPVKPITFSICEWGTAKPWEWGAKAGNMWRTTHDIFANWKSIMFIYNYTLKLYKFAAPGHWNDPDMLEVGNGKLSEDENRSHFSLWCMMAAPLILGNDIREFVDENGEADKENAVLKIVTNKRLIAVDQDALGKPAKRIKKSRGIDIIARPLSNGDVAVCFLNCKSCSNSVRYNISDLSADEYLNFPSASSYELHNLWSDERTTGTTISATMPKHGVMVYRIKAQ